MMSSMSQWLDLMDSNGSSDLHRNDNMSFLAAWTTFDLSDFAVDPDSDEFDALRSGCERTVMIMMYCLVIGIGGLGNALVVITLIRNNYMWNATNIFIGCLALTDLLVCLLNLPFSLYYQLNNDWPFGSLLCHVIPTLFAVAVYISSFSLTMIAVDR